MSEAAAGAAAPGRSEHVGDAAEVVARRAARALHVLEAVGHAPIAREEHIGHHVEGVQQVFSEDGKLSLLVDDSNLALPRLFETAAPLGIRITEIEILEPDLEAVFLQLTGRALRD